MYSRTAAENTATAGGQPSPGISDKSYLRTVYAMQLSCAGVCRRRDKLAAGGAEFDLPKSV